MFALTISFSYNIQKNLGKSNILISNIYYNKLFVVCIHGSVSKNIHNVRLMYGTLDLLYNNNKKFKNHGNLHYEN